MGEIRAENNKYHHELKYLISDMQMQILQTRIKGLMFEDPHTGKEGSYQIRSLYFDDYYNSCFYDNEDGNDYRKKYRIRIYNHSDQIIHLECKEKVHGKTKKRMCELSKAQAESLLAGEMLPAFSEQPRVLQELNEAVQTRLMRPKVIVEYERFPFVYSCGNVRVTFDTNLRSSAGLGDFFEENLRGRAVFPTGMQLLEVKFDEYLPDTIYRMLQLENLQQTTFSKFYYCRKIYIR